MKRLSILVCVFAIYLLVGGAALASGAGGIYGDEDKGTRTWYEKVFDFTINHWGADGFDEIEADVVIDLLRIASYDEDSALQIAHMPFLASVEPPDVMRWRLLRDWRGTGSPTSSVSYPTWLPRAAFRTDGRRRDPGPANPALPIGMWLLDEAYVTFWDYRLRGDKVSARIANSIDRWLIFNFGYKYEASSEITRLYPEIEVPLEVVVYYEDGFIIDRRSVRGDVRLRVTNVGRADNIAISPSKCWPKGQYWIHLYHGEQKLAEVPYEVIP